MTNHNQKLEKILKKIQTWTDENYSNHSNNKIIIKYLHSNNEYLLCSIQSPIKENLNIIIKREINISPKKNINVKIEKESNYLFIFNSNSKDDPKIKELSSKIEYILNTEKYIININDENFDIISDDNFEDFYKKILNSSLNLQEIKSINEKITINSQILTTLWSQEGQTMNNSSCNSLIIGTSVVIGCGLLALFLLYQFKKIKTTQPKPFIKEEFLILFAWRQETENTENTIFFTDELFKFAQQCNWFGYINQKFLDDIISQNKNKEDCFYTLLAIKDVNSNFSAIKTQFNYAERNSLSALKNKDVVYKCIQVSGPVLEKLQMKSRG